MNVHAGVVARLDDAAATTGRAPLEADNDEMAESAGPLTLAIQVGDDDVEPDATPSEQAAPAT